MNATSAFQRLLAAVDRIADQPRASEQQRLMVGRLLSENVRLKRRVASLSEVEFRVFSQWGDDGIIQWLLNSLEFPNRTFIEFGVDDYRESNTRFLMMNNNWTGMVMDGSRSKVARIVASGYFWRYELQAIAAFVDKDNVNRLIASAQFDKEVGILHIDLDGNDYWIWKVMDGVSPVVVILEYNSVFGPDRSITVPYDKGFRRARAHFSNLYWGASIRALYQLSADKGYSFIGCSSAGNNAYFVRTDKLNDVVRATSLDRGYVLSKFRESRDAKNRLTYLAGNDRLKAIRGMPVYNTDTNELEQL